MKKIDEISAICLIKNNEYYLFQLRDRIPIRDSGKWVLPGGKKESGEDDLDCAKREFYEETNYIIRTPKLIYTSFILKYGFEGYKLSIFEEIYDNKQKIYCKEGQSAKFINFKKFNLYNVDPFIKKLILKRRNDTLHKF